jgi:hypothetical protein
MPIPHSAYLARSEQAALNSGGRQYLGVPLSQAQTWPEDFRGSIGHGAILGARIDMFHVKHPSRSPVLVRQFVGLFESAGTTSL